MSEDKSSSLSEGRVPLVVVISGPSGVGKDAIIDRLAERGFDFHFTVTATTRPPRPGEVDGVNHHFVSEDEFKDLIENDQLIEWAEVYGNYYGAPKQQVRDALADGKHVITRVDVQGALRIKQLAPKSVMVFVHAPNMETLRKRIERRGVNSQRDLETRIAAAETEIENSKQFDYQVINHEGALDAVTDEVIAIINDESRNPTRRNIAVQ